ncbi:MAG: replication factor C small subunit [Nanoarchaeota archaeon]
MNITNQIWVDKYRPKTFNEIIGQKFFISRIKAFIESKNLPHLLFAGAPGTGKTTTALVIARELYGEDGVRGNFLELNASDDRGIDIIRNQIKEFAKLKSLTNLPYKIVCLDEADSLTKEAQQALRRTMERYSSSCRFVLACNEISKLIDPIQSRCVVFKFKPLEKEDLYELLNRIEREENLKIEKNAKELLVRISKGDTRKIINTLQAGSSIDKKVTTKLIEEILDFIDPKEVKLMLNSAIDGDFFKARDYMVKLKAKRGLTGLEILKEIYKQIIDMDIDPKVKIKTIDRIATIEFRIVEGSDEELQLESLLAMMSLIKI